MQRLQDLVRLHNNVVITSNTGEFTRVEGLKVEDWTV